MNIDSITLYHVAKELKEPFITSAGSVTTRDSILVEVKDKNGTIGWGEVVAFSTPWYTEETIQTCWHMLEDILIPLLYTSPFNHPREIRELFLPIKRNAMAKAGLESALWDLYAKQNGVSLATLLGGTREKVETGVVVSIESLETCLTTIQQRIEEGYQRIKVKIKPGYDEALIQAIRERFPDLPLMADANSAYSLEDIPLLKKLDPYQLLMIEQPLASDDIVDHAKLQKELQTAICLDESICSLADARKAIELGSTNVINIKLGRVGGLQEALLIHNHCQTKGIPVWCGGMLELGIGRAHNIALASLPQFTIPGDLSASSRYWDEDIIEPAFTMENGKVTVPSAPGIGVEVIRQRVEKITKKCVTFPSLA